MLALAISLVLVLGVLWACLRLLRRQTVSRRTTSPSPRPALPVEVLHIVFGHLVESTAGPGLVRTLAAASLASEALCHLVQPVLHRFMCHELNRLIHPPPDSLADYALATLQRFELVCRTPASVSRLSARAVESAEHWRWENKQLSRAAWRKIPCQLQRPTKVANPRGGVPVYSYKPFFLDGISASITHLEIDNLVGRDVNTLASMPNLRSVTVLSTAGPFEWVYDKWRFPFSFLDPPVTTLVYRDSHSSKDLGFFFSCFAALTSLTVHLNPRWPSCPALPALQLSRFHHLRSFTVVTSTLSGWWCTERDLQRFVDDVEMALSPVVYPADLSPPWREQYSALQVFLRVPDVAGDAAFWATMGALRKTGLLRRISDEDEFARIESVRVEVEEPDEA